VRFAFLGQAKRQKTKTQAFTSLQGVTGYFYNLYMRKSRAAGLLFLATAALAQHQQSVEITSEPTHHLVFQNEYVRVFNVTVAPRATTLVHRHNYDYLFVTLGDSDVVSVRPGEKPVALKLKDGEVRFTPGNFAHAAVNQSDRPFHNITIELLKPSSNVKTCTDSCDDLSDPCAGICTQRRKLISSDQWSVWLITVPPTAHAEKYLHAVPQLIVPVSNLGFGAKDGSNDTPIIRGSGQIDWLTGSPMHALINNTKTSASFIALEFNQGKQ
jgi:quercetin dioxygenase-like cupin family protein